MSQLLEHLKEMDRNWTLLGSPNVVDKFILKHGKVYEPVVSHPDLKTGTPKECYSNALHYAIRHKLKYVEGKCVDPSLGIAFDHAWCEDENGLALDITLKEPENYQYFGVAFDADSARKEVWANKVYGLFWTPMLNAKLLHNLDPDFFKTEFSEDLAKKLIELASPKKRVAKGKK